MDVLLTYPDGSSETINVAQPLADKLRDEHGERFYLYKPAMIEIMAAEIKRLNAQLDAVAGGCDLTDEEYAAAQNEFGA